MMPIAVLHVVSRHHTSAMKLLDSFLRYLTKVYGRPTLPTPVYVGSSILENNWRIENCFSGKLN